MCPREIEIRCGDPNFFPRIFGAYTRIDNETEGFPVYHHKNPEIDGAIWYKSKIGWLIGPKCHIGSIYCYACADMDGRAAPLLESNNYHWRDTLTTSTIRIQLFEIMSERSGEGLVGGPGTSCLGPRRERAQAACMFPARGSASRPARVGQARRIHLLRQTRELARKSGRGALAEKRAWVAAISVLRRTVDSRFSRPPAICCPASLPPHPMLLRCGRYGKEPARMRRCADLLVHIFSGW